MGQVTLAEMRAEMARLAGILVETNQKYLDREQEVIQLHAKGANGYTGQLITVMNNDLLLNGYSSVAKTVAVLATAMGTVIQAELAYAAALGGAARQKRTETIKQALDEYTRRKTA
jgi:hypothetical protein